ncbi:conserved hypothetical protein [Tenacibaculum sp. 190524A05c]|uniref:hypothetical protein n=1 Tax=Tenacibaculum platacis TaxID=3137852 RepID=UPI0031FA6D1C
MSNLTTSINLKDSGRHQFLIASQNYGTFYCIYGKFHLKENSNILSHVELELLNYKGTCNLGFVNHNDHNQIRVSTTTDNLDKKILFIEIPLVGFENNTKTNITATNFIENEEINIDNIDGVRVFRGLVKNQNIIDKIFDEEFSYRDGKIEDDRYNDDELTPPIGLYLSMNHWINDQVDFSNKATGDHCFTSNLKVTRDI